MTDKVAVLIDGGYYLRRLRYVHPDVDDSDPESVACSIRQLINNHLTQLNRIYNIRNHYHLSYRCFFYDGEPYANKTHLPVSKNYVDFSNSNPQRRTLQDDQPNALATSQDTGQYTDG